MMQSHQVISDITQLSEAKSYALVCSSVPRTKKNVAGVLWIGGLSELSKPPAPTKEHINLGLCSSCLSMLDFVLLGWTTQTTKSEASFISIHSIGFNLLVMAGSVASMSVIKQNIMVMKACDRGCLSHGRLKDRQTRVRLEDIQLPRHSALLLSTRLLLWLFTLSQ